MHGLTKPATSTRRCRANLLAVGEPDRRTCQAFDRQVFLLVVVLSAMALTGARQCLADVRPETMNGPPLLPIPTFEEVGLPTFTMPVGTPSTPPSTPPGGVPGGGTVATSWDQYAGQVVGSGECVALVQTADSGVGLTRTWAQGSQVQGNTELRPGTTIATFNGEGRYANLRDGSSHTAIYLGQNAEGIQVLDQWAGSPAAYRTIRWSSATGMASNTGSKFYVVTRAS